MRYATISLRKLSLIFSSSHNQEVYLFPVLILVLLCLVITLCGNLSNSYRNVPVIPRVFFDQTIFILPWVFYPFFNLFQTLPPSAPYHFCFSFVSLLPFVFPLYSREESHAVTPGLFSTFQQLNKC